MEISQECLDDFKRIFKKEFDQDLDDSTAREYARNLLGFYKTLYDIALREERRKEKLKESPNGYPIPNTEGYSCWLCRNSNPDWEYWYDKNGMKCPPCQQALDDGVIPERVMQDEKSWLSMDDVRRKLNLHHTTVKKMIRTGELKARIIQNNGYDYFWVFLKEENVQLANE